MHLIDDTTSPPCPLHTDSETRPPSVDRAPVTTERQAASYTHFRFTRPAFHMGLSSPCRR